VGEDDRPHREIAVSTKRVTEGVFGLALSHGVDVMLKVHAKCIDGQRDVANQRILDALAA
jgi:ATP-dependent Clp protease adapter protein ClpS